MSLMDWHEVQFYESSGNVREAVRMTIGRDPSATVTRSIAVCMQQGRSFMSTAVSASLDIRPLLIYYGAVAFAKAVVLARRLVTLSTLASSHGLKDVSERGTRISGLVCSILAKGTFQDFSETVGQLGRVRFFDNETMPQHISKPFDSVLPLTNTRITLRDVLSRVPGLEELYTRTYGESAKCLSLILAYRGDGDVAEVRIDEPEIFTDRASIVQIVERLRTDYPFLNGWQLHHAERAWGKSILEFVNVDKRDVDEFNSGILVEDDGQFRAKISKEAAVRDLPPFIQPMAGGLADQYPTAIQPLNGCFLSEYSLAFVGSFLLGTLVRYRPETWHHSLSRSTLPHESADDRELALIEMFLEYVVRALPTLAVQVLKEE